MFKFRNVLTALTIVLLVQLLMMPAIGAMHDQQQDQQEQERNGMLERNGLQPGEYYSANEIIGMDVTNQQGENLGTINEIVLDQQQQKVAYVVLATGGFLGMGQDLHAVPWDAIQLHEDEVLINISQQQLNQMQGFDSNNWPDMADQQWQQRTRQQWQERNGMRRDEEMRPDMDRRRDAERRRDEEMRPDESRRERDGMQDQNGQRQQQQRQQELQRQQQQQQHERDGMQQRDGQQQTYQQRQQQQRQQNGMWQQDQQRQENGRQPRMRQQQRDMEHRRLSEIIGTTVENPQGENLGSIEDVMISEQGEVKFGVIGVGGVLGIDEEYTAVPWQSLFVDIDAGTARLDATQQQLEQFAVEDHEELKSQLQQQQFVSRLEQQFQAAQPPREPILGFEPPTMQQRQQAWGKDGQYLQQFDADQVEEYTGTIESVGTFQPERGAMPGVRVRIRTQDDEMHTVHLGPRQYIQQQGIQLQRGSEITIQGAQAQFRGDEVIIIAQSIKIPREVELIDDQGQPQWQTDQLRERDGMRRDDEYRDEEYRRDEDPRDRERDGMFQQQQQQQLQAWQSDSQYLQKFDSDNVEEYTGTIQAMGTFEPERGAASGIKLLVRTEDGQMHTVHIGPRQFIEQKDIQLQRGKEITLQGAEADFQGDSVIIAQSFEIDDQEVELLNDQGQPQWQPDQLMERNGMRQDEQHRQDQQRRQDEQRRQDQQHRQNGTM